MSGYWNGSSAGMDWGGLGRNWWTIRYAAGEGQKKEIFQLSEI